MAVVCFWEFAIILLRRGESTSNAQKGFYGFYYPLTAVSVCGGVSVCVIEVSECLGKKKSQHTDLEMAPLHNANWPSQLWVSTRWIHTCTDHTHAHIRTDRPPARFGGHVKYTSIIPERHPELEKDTNTHKYPHCGHPVITNRLDR